MSADNTRQQTPEELEPASKAQVKKPKVLATDHESCVLESIRSILEGAGYEVALFTDNVEALYKLDRIKPDVVITDLAMPKLSGFRFIKLVKKLDPSVPVIVLSASVDPRYDVNGEKAQEAIQLGAFACVAKPIDVLELRQTVARALEARKSGNPVSETDSAALVEMWFQNGEQCYVSCGSGGGGGWPENYAEALNWYRRAAEQGHVEAQFSVGLCYALGKGVSQDHAEARARYWNASDQDLTEAVKWFRTAAEQGHAEAQFNLGLHYAFGRGVVKDHAEAFKWYRKAADQGHTKAQFSVGLCYAVGSGVSQDYAEAVRWFRKAADKGNTEAQFVVGLCHAFGWGVPQDYAEAAKCQRIVSLGMENLTKAYERGLEPLQEHHEKGAWSGDSMEHGAGMVKSFRVEAERGEAQGQFSLAICYERGIALPQDLIEAYKWLKLAAAQGRPQPARLTSLLSTMTAEQIQEGERRFRDFKPNHYRFKPSQYLSEVPVQSNKPKVLATDDEPGFLKSMTIVLKDKYDVAALTSKVEAVRRLAEIKPDVVITDIHSPDMNGLDFIRLVKEFDPTIPAIILTGYVTMESAREAVRLGVFEYLNKPFGVARLRQTVARALEARRENLQK
jgi:TPR repeat protein/DNA-binding response OmpR family regulator